MRYPYAFLTIFDFIIQQETGGDPNGGYTNDPDDPGGETKWGISKKTFPTLIIADTTKEEAQSIYYDIYWRNIDIDGIPDEIKMMLCDMGVNCGVETAKKYLQKAVGVEVDGVIGPKTIEALNRYGFPCIVYLYGAWRRIYYLTIISKNTTLNKYTNGWFSRVTALEKLVNRLWHD